MGRPSVNVDITELRSIIGKLESNGPLASQQELWERVAESFKNDKITAAVIRLRCEANNISIITPAAKRGRKVGVINQLGIRKGRGAKYESNIGKKHIAALKVELGPKYYPLIEKIQAGSIKAAIKGACLFCTGCQPLEIKECEILSCPLYLIRPYQKKAKV